MLMYSLFSQHDHSIAMASVPGPAAHQFVRFPGSSFQPTISSASAFGIGAGATLHPTTAFPGDVYGVSGVSERPKKVLYLHLLTLNASVIIIERFLTE